MQLLLHQKKALFEKVLNLPYPLLGIIVSDARRPDLPDLICCIAPFLDLVFLRDRAASDEALQKAASVIAENKSSTTKLIVNSPIYKDWFQTEDIDGWHLPETGNLTPFQKFKGRSVHSIAAAQKAKQERMDYIIAGTIFETASHPSKQPKGLQLLRGIKDACPDLPMLAIGGIQPDNAANCLKAGASGIVVHSGIFCAKDPAKAAQNYRQALDDYSND